MSKNNKNYFIAIEFWGDFEGLKFHKYSSTTIFMDINKEELGARACDLIVESYPEYKDVSFKFKINSFNNIS